MLRTGDGRTQLVELQSFDERYPLYGEVALQPSAPLGAALALRGGLWGAAVDPALAERLGVKVGDRVQVGSLAASVRAIVARQPDRSLRADWSGPPVLIAAEALPATGLIGPGSRVAYRYRVKIGASPERWRSELAAAFPDAGWEVRTFAERGERVAEVLDQVASGLLLIGFSALFVGGLGVFNSVHAYLQSRLATIATLRALGLRDLRLAAIYAGQVLLLAGAASLAGALLGGALALAGAAVVAERLPVATTLAGLAWPLALAWGFGVLTAVAFALPPIGRALSVTPAALFRGIDAAATRTPPAYWYASGACAALTVALLVAAVPDWRFGLGFVAVILLLLGLLEVLVRLLRRSAQALAELPWLAQRFELRLALASLYRPGSALRASLLSLGSALTLLVACALVLGALLRTVNDTIPERAPALVFYDVPAAQLDEFRDMVGRSAGFQRLDTAPLVLGRLEAVNGEELRHSRDLARALEARDEHKLSYRAQDFDHLAVTRGAWWSPEHRGPALVAMEDREADALGLKLGDVLRFAILGETLEARLAAIYAQRRFQSRFWFEAIFSDGALDAFITRHVGAAYLDPGKALALQNRLALEAPSVVTVRTEGLLAEARQLLGRAAAGLALVGAVTLLASLLVLASIMAGTVASQVYAASILHALGARLEAIRRSLQLEYLVLATLTCAFALGVGGAIAVALLRYRIQLEGENPWWPGVAVALFVSGASLASGARYLLRRLRVTPATLLRSGG
jgi:putative ABC transport system permease protein